MEVLNLEIKARTDNPDRIERLLMEANARLVGIDHQTDTYYQVESGRLKLRQGNIENTLIQYHRIEKKGIKESRVNLYKSNPSGCNDLKRILNSLFEQLCVVEKKRKIFFIDNVKFHIDSVKSLGSFVEIEAIDEDGSRTEEILRTQCAYFMDLLALENQQLVDSSYSDMILHKEKAESNQ
jgi:predicted adenylyl cyclase CyaB